MSRLLGLISLGAIVFYLIRDSYIGELASSFLPYLVVGWIIVALVSLIVALASKKRWTKIVSGVSFVILIGMSVWGGRQIYDFYHTKEGDDRVIGGLEGFSVLYDNIYAYNFDYQSLNRLITMSDPDILVLVEFARHHRSNLQTTLTDAGLTHTNRINRDMLYDSNLFASHYPIQQVVTYEGLDDYINIESQQVRIRDHEVMFHVVHTISPVSPGHFVARNQQLISLATIMHQATQNYPDHIHILLGDFNTSPWSVYYEKFQADLGSTWINQTRQLPLLMTRKMPIPRIQSHIDHVWIRGDATATIDSYRLSGSDHKVLDLQIQ